MSSSLALAWASFSRMAAADEWGRDQLDANAREHRFLAIEQHAVYELRNAGDQARRCVALGDSCAGAGAIMTAGPS